MMSSIKYGIPFLIFFIISTAQGWAQNKNRDYIQFDYEISFYNGYPKPGNHVAKNGTSGFGLEFGQKRLLGENPCFLKYGITAFIGQMPVGGEIAVFGGSLSEKERRYNEHIYPSGFYTTFKELDFGANCMFGYDFILNNKLTLELFGGPDVRYLVNTFKDEVDNCFKKNTHKINLRLKAGVGLNYNNINFNLSVVPDILDRGKGNIIYRNIAVALGVGYYF